MVSVRTSVAIDPTDALGFKPGADVAGVPIMLAQVIRPLRDVLMAGDKPEVNGLDLCPVLRKCGRVVFYVHADHCHPLYAEYSCFAIWQKMLHSMSGSSWCVPMFSGNSSR